MDINLSIKRKFPNRIFYYSYNKISIKGQHFFNSYPEFLNFDTLYDTVSKQISTKKYNFIFVFWKIAGDSPVSGRSCLIGRHFFI